MSVDKLKLEKFMKEIAKFKNLEGNILPILHHAQDTFDYVPYEAIELIAEFINESPNMISGVVSFYSHFTQHQLGKTKVGVCTGTSCHVNGAKKVLDEASKITKLSDGETSSDLEISMIETKCIGKCDIGPNVLVNEDEYNGVTKEGIIKILKSYLN